MSIVHIETNIQTSTTFIIWTMRTILPTKRHEHGLGIVQKTSKQIHKKLSEATINSYKTKNGI